MTNPAPSPSGSPRNWNVNTCPSCGGKFKTAFDSSDTELACPHCGEVVASPERESPTETTKPESRAPWPAADAVNDDNTRFPGLEAGKSTGRKRRKAAKAKDPEWDRDPSTRRQPAQSGEVKDFTDRYTGDPNDPDSARIKRVRRKKNLTGTEKFGRGLLITTVGIIVLATGIAVALLVKKQFEVVATEAEEQRELPKKVADLVAQALAAKNDSAILTKDEEKACLSIVNGFYAAKTIEEKLSFVRLPERVRPMIERAYADPATDGDFRVGEIILSQKLIDKDRRFITIAASVAGSDGKSQLFAFEQKEDSILMDWEVSSGYQPLPIQDFIARRVSEPTAFRAKVTLSNYYAGSFQDKTRYQSVSLTYPGQNEFKLAGYIDRQQKWADALLARLDFEAPSLIVTLSYPPNSPSAFEVEVTGVVLDSWFY